MSKISLLAQSYLPFLNFHPPLLDQLQAKIAMIDTYEKKKDLEKSDINAITQLDIAVIRLFYAQNKLLASTDAQAKKIKRFNQEAYFLYKQQDEQRRLDKKVSEFSAQAERLLANPYDASGSFANLPDELVVNVAKHLDAVSLFRFSSACRRFRTFLNDPSLKSSPLSTSDLERLLPDVVSESNTQPFLFSTRGVYFKSDKMVVGINCVLDRKSIQVFDQVTRRTATIIRQPGFLGHPVGDVLALAKVSEEYLVSSDGKLLEFWRRNGMDFERIKARYSPTWDFVAITVLDSGKVVCAGRDCISVFEVCDNNFSITDYFTIPVIAVYGRGISLVALPNSDRVAMANATSSKIEIWDIKDHKLVEAITTELESIGGLRVLKNGYLIYEMMDRFSAQGLFCGIARPGSQLEATAPRPA